MIIKFNGTTTFNKLEEMTQEIVGKVEAQLGEKVEAIKVKDAELGIVLTVGGEERYLTVNHDGLDEVFTMFVKLDDEGNIEVQKDNAEETLLDDYTRAVMKNEELPTYERIESIYRDDELTFISESGSSDVGIVEQVFTNTDGNKVIRYVQYGVGLIQEITQKK